MAAQINYQADDAAPVAVVIDIIYTAEDGSKALLPSQIIKQGATMPTTGGGQ